MSSRQIVKKSTESRSNDNGGGGPQNIVLHFLCFLRLAQNVALCLTRQWIFGPLCCPSCRIPRLGLRLFPGIPTIDSLFVILHLFVRKALLVWHLHPIYVDREALSAAYDTFVDVTERQEESREKNLLDGQEQAEHGVQSLTNLKPSVTMRTWIPGLNQSSLNYEYTSHVYPNALPDLRLAVSAMGSRELRQLQVPRLRKLKQLTLMLPAPGNGRRDGAVVWVLALDEVGVRSLCLLRRARGVGGVVAPVLSWKRKKPYSNRMFNIARQVPSDDWLPVLAFKCAYLDEKYSEKPAASNTSTISWPSSRGDGRLPHLSWPLVTEGIIQGDYFGRRRLDAEDGGGGTSSSQNYLTRALGFTKAESSQGLEQQRKGRLPVPGLERRRAPDSAAPVPFYWLREAAMYSCSRILVGAFSSRHVLESAALVAATIGGMAQRDSAPGSWSARSRVGTFLSRRLSSPRRSAGWLSAIVEFGRDEMDGGQKLGGKRKILTWTGSMSSTPIYRHPGFSPTLGNFFFLEGLERRRAPESAAPVAVSQPRVGGMAREHELLAALNSHSGRFRQITVFFFSEEPDGTWTPTVLIHFQRLSRGPLVTEGRPQRLLLLRADSIRRRSTTAASAGVPSLRLRPGSAGRPSSIIEFCGDEMDGGQSWEVRRYVGTDEEDLDGEENREHRLAKVLFSEVRRTSRRPLVTEGRPPPLRFVEADSIGLGSTVGGMAWRDRIVSMDSIDRVANFGGQKPSAGKSNRSTNVLSYTRTVSCEDWDVNVFIKTFSTNIRPSDHLQQARKGDQVLLAQHEDHVTGSPIPYLSNGKKCPSGFRTASNIFTSLKPSAFYELKLGHVLSSLASADSDVLRITLVASSLTTTNGLALQASVIPTTHLVLALCSKVGWVTFTPHVELRTSLRNRWWRYGKVASNVPSGRQFIQQNRFLETETAVTFKRPFMVSRIILPDLTPDVTASK
ncbi:hypothetical protein DFH06DRAFT_1135017 [Mycena polygramma]|nr:hypothetical protein DFH06DRAFT_1135017 [Mycena polygramma]